MPTYGRPEYVPEALWCFCQQDYPNKELILLNDCAGQEYVCDLPGVRAINTTARSPTLGDKRNDAIEMALGEYIAIWDDDDLYLPWRLSFSLQEAQRHGTPFYRPGEFVAYWGDPELHNNRSVPGWISHSSVMFTKQLWRDVGRYPAANLGEDSKFFASVHDHLDQEFIKYPIARSDRFYLLRGTSMYQHMSISGGERPPDTTEKRITLEPRQISDEVLRGCYDRLCDERGIHSPKVAISATAPPAALPVLSICIALKNRSRLQEEDRLLDLFPRTVRSISDAANEVGPIELIVADFASDDWPLTEWLSSSQNLTVKIVPVDGPFSRGRGLNAAVKVASCDTLFITDADVLVTPAALRNGLANAEKGNAYFPIFRYYDLNGNPDDWCERGYGLAFLSRDVFDSCGDIPEFESWGGEDDVFFAKVKRQCRAVRGQDAEFRHQWHPEWSRHRYYRSSAFADFCVSGREEVANNIPVLTTMFEVGHPDWGNRENRIQLFENGRFARPGIDCGTYQLRRHDRITLQWDKWPTEEACWDESKKLYRSEDGRFTLREMSQPDQVVKEIRREHEDLKEHLKSIQPFQFVGLKGNRGDLIIEDGTLNFFRTHNLDFIKVADFSELESELPTVLVGSGGFCRFWTNAPSVALRLAKSCRSLIVLPSSYERSSVELLRDIPNVFLYSREHASHEVIKEDFESAYCPDMAFWADLPELREASQTTKFVFRTDQEGFMIGSHYPNNQDLSVGGEWTADAFSREVTDCRVLFTDRLHAAIVAAMKGCRVNLFPGRYHKNRALFESSLRQFDCVWHEEGDHMRSF